MSSRNLTRFLFIIVSRRFFKYDQSRNHFLSWVTNYVYLRDIHIILLHWILYIHIVYIIRTIWFFLEIFKSSLYRRLMYRKNILDTCRYIYIFFFTFRSSHLQFFNNLRNPSINRVNNFSRKTYDLLIFLRQFHDEWFHNVDLWILKSRKEM